jgi:RimJ/RimL family protein N-acetyltransferase
VKRDLPSSLDAYGVNLRRLERADIELVRTWRNHPEVARHMLSQAHITAEQQLNWFIRIDAASDRAHYLVSHKGQPTAFASVTSNTGEALAESDILEAAIYLAPDSRCRGTMLAFAPALALNDACFDALRCTQLVARVRRENAAALRFNARMGYRETGIAGNLVHLALSRDDYVAATGPIKAMLSRQGSRQEQTGT